MTIEPMRSSISALFQYSLVRARERLTRAWKDELPLKPPWSWLMTGGAALYGRGLQIRSKHNHAHHVRHCRVISVGNLTVGGTGKTPFTAFLARHLAAGGYRVAIISRGYKGELEKSGGVVSDGDRILVDAAAAGDEPLMLAARLPGIPVLVGRDRYHSLLGAVRNFKTEIAILDDGFQHIRVHRDLDLVLMDSQRPLGNGRLLPAGPLREPFRALDRAHGLILICKDGSLAPSRPTELASLKQPLFQAGQRAYVRSVVSSGHILKLSALQETADKNPTFGNNRKIFAFSGIARNENFHRTLHDFGWQVVGAIGFEDHHRYSPSDLQLICTKARSCHADLIATTEKDYVRLAHRGTWPLDLMVVGIEIDLHNLPGLDAFLKARLSQC